MRNAQNGNRRMGWLAIRTATTVRTTHRPPHRRAQRAIGLFSNNNMMRLKLTVRNRRENSVQHFAHLGTTIAHTPAGSFEPYRAVIPLAHYIEILVIPNGAVRIHDSIGDFWIAYDCYSVWIRPALVHRFVTHRISSGVIYPKGAPERDGIKSQLPRRIGIVAQLPFLDDPIVAAETIRDDEGGEPPLGGWSIIAVSQMRGHMPHAVRRIKAAWLVADD